MYWYTDQFLAKPHIMHHDSLLLVYVIILDTTSEVKEDSGTLEKVNFSIIIYIDDLKSD